MTKRPVICVTEPIHPEAIARLAAVAEVVGPGEPARNWPEIADAVIVRSVPITADDLQRAGHLRVIGKHGTGTDTIDLVAAQKKGIPVLTAAGANADSVADLAIGLALMLVRSPDIHDAALRAGTPASATVRQGFELSELPAGIVGLGTIGKAVSHRLLYGFGADVTAYDPTLSASDWPQDIKRAPDFETVLRGSRIVFLHLPLMEQTRHLINAKALALMPKGAFLVNCARGGIVDEFALAEALQRGHLAGAASDVFQEEPPQPAHPLFAAGRFIATPHIGASTEAALRRTGLIIADRVLSALQTTNT